MPRVDRHDGIEIVERLLRQGHDPALDTGIVAGTVEAPECLDRGLDQRLDICRNGNVGAEEFGLATCRTDQVARFRAA